MKAAAADVGSADRERLQQEAAALGLPLAAVDQAIGEQGPRDCLVWPENWPAVCLFLDCQTQWRSGPGGLLGLDYGAVLAMARLSGVKGLRDTMADVRIIEATILSEINRKRAN